MPEMPFHDWKRHLLADAAQQQHRGQLRDYVLVLFWSDNCEPTIQSIRTYAETRRRATRGRALLIPDAT
jgi:hypothetical protein